MTTDSSSVNYWRGLHEWHLSGVSTPCSKDTLQRYLKDESFRPDPKNGNAVSMCAAGAIPEEEFLSNLQSLQNKSSPNPKQYKAIAVLSEDELAGFILNRNDTPFKGHVDAIHRGYPYKSKKERQLLRDKLKKLSIERGIRFFGYKDGKFYEINNDT